MIEEYNIDSYIEKCIINKTGIDNMLNEFIEMLNNIKENPSLIFTDYFKHLDNPILFITNFSGNTLSEVFIPIIKNIYVFNDIELEYSTNSDNFNICNNSHILMNINLKENTFINYCKKPKWSNYQYNISKQIQSKYDAICALEIFYKHRTIKNWLNFTDFNNTNKSLKVFFENFIFLKKTEKVNKIIEQVKIYYETAKDFKIDGKKRFEEETKLWNNNKDKILKIENYLLNLGYKNK